MSAMIKATLIHYPTWIAATGVVVLVLLYSFLTVWVFRKRVKPGLDYASRLPFESEKEINHGK